MAYFIEWSLSRGEGLYAEFLIKNKNNRCLIDGQGIDHQFLVRTGFCDYGFPSIGGQLIASNSNGLITAPVPGVVAMNIPPAIMCGLASSFVSGGNSYDFCGERPANVVQCKMIAVPEDPTLTKTLFTGTISFGDRAMSDPRITLGVFPLYPNSPTACVLSCEVAQLKQQLAQLGLYDQVEAGLAGPTDPATISWNNGGQMTLGGPLANKVSAILSTAPGQPLDLTAMMTAASRTLV